MPLYNANFSNDEMNMQWVFFILSFILLFKAHPISILQSKETCAEWSRIPWVPQQVHSACFVSSWYLTSIVLDYFSTRQQAGHGYCPRYSVESKISLCEPFWTGAKSRIFHCGYLSGMVLFQYLLLSNWNLTKSSNPSLSLSLVFLLPFSLSCAIFHHSPTWAAQGNIVDETSQPLIHLLWQAQDTVSQVII